MAVGGENLRIEILALTYEGHGCDKMTRASRLYLAFPAGQVSYPCLRC